MVERGERKREEGKKKREAKNQCMLIGGGAM